MNGAGKNRPNHKLTTCVICEKGFSNIDLMYYDYEIIYGDLVHSNCWHVMCVPPFPKELLNTKKGDNKNG